MIVLQKLKKIKNVLQQCRVVLQKINKNKKTCTIVQSSTTKTIKNKIMRYNSVG